MMLMLCSQDAEDIGEVRDEEIEDVDELGHFGVGIGDVVLEIRDELDHGLENRDDALQSRLINRRKNLVEVRTLTPMTSPSASAMGLSVEPSFSGGIALATKLASSMASTISAMRPIENSLLSGELTVIGSGRKVNELYI